MISEAAITNAVKQLNTSKGISISQVFEKLGMTQTKGDANYIASVLRKLEFSKEHKLTTITRGQRAYLWFPNLSTDPRDVEIRELKAEIKRLTAELDIFKGREIDSFMTACREANNIIEPSRAISAQLNAIPEIPDSLLEEEFEAMRKALEE